LFGGRGERGDGKGWMGGVGMRESGRGDLIPRQILDQNMHGAAFSGAGSIWAL
jgi:hypothetical protein